MIIWFNHTFSSFRSYFVAVHHHLVNKRFSFVVVHHPIASCAFPLWSSSMNDCTRAMASWSSTMPHGTLALKGFIPSPPERHASAAYYRRQIILLSRKWPLLYEWWPFLMVFASIKTIDWKRVFLLPQLTSSQHHRNKLLCNPLQNRRQHLPAVQLLQLCQ